MVEIRQTEGIVFENLDREERLGNFLRLLTPHEFVVMELKTDGLTNDEPMSTKSVARLLKYSETRIGHDWDQIKIKAELTLR